MGNFAENLNLGNRVRPPWKKENCCVALKWNFWKVGLAVWKIIIIPKDPRNCKSPPSLVLPLHGLREFVDLEHRVWMELGLFCENEMSTFEYKCRDRGWIVLVGCQRLGEGVGWIVGLTDMLHPKLVGGGGRSWFRQSPASSMRPMLWVLRWRRS